MPKPSRSAFYFYALEYQRRSQRNNGNRISINDAIAACYDEWKLLSDEDKQPYKIFYEEWRLQYRLDPESATNSHQHYIQSKKSLKQEMKNERILSERDIPCEELKIHYDRFSLERDFLAFEYLPLDINELLTMPIYLINFQIFCKVDEEDGGQYVPAEMCILRYSLAEGATLFRQTFIKPDKIPPGYMSACLEHLKSTHEIPLKDFAEATDNYQLIYQQLKSLLMPTMVKKTNPTATDDDRSRRRQLRFTQPCVFFPAVEYEQTSRLIDWLQEKAEGVKPTKDTRLVSFASVESLIMLLVELKKQRVSRDDIHKTFENAAYSFMIEERCNYHSKLGISHCAVARCYASAKLISAYLNQLYVPDRPASIMMAEKRSQSSFMMNSDASSIASMNNTSHRVPQPVLVRPSLASEIISSQYSSTGTSDSIASSYRPPEQKKQQTQLTPTFVQSSSRSSSAKYPYQSQPPSSQQDLHVSDELIHHPTIVKLQQQNFHRLLSTVGSTASSSSAVQHQQHQQFQTHSTIDDDQATIFSTTTATNERSQPVKPLSDNQRIVLHQRKQALMKAIQNINQQMEELDM